MSFIGSELKDVSRDSVIRIKVTNLATCYLAGVHGAVVSMREHANTSQKNDDGLEEKFHRDKIYWKMATGPFN